MKSVNELIRSIQFHKAVGFKSLEVRGTLTASVKEAIRKHCPRSDFQPVCNTEGKQIKTRIKL